MVNNYDDWKYYNHALIPNTAPHIIPNLELLKDKKKFSKKKWGGNKPLLIRYTTDYDKVDNSNWWFVICDKPFDINLLNTKKRYQIKQARKNFDVKIINPLDYAKELYFVYEETQKSYPKENRNSISLDKFIEYLTIISKNDRNVFYAAFYKDNNLIVGYCVSPEYDSYTELQSQKAIPSYEKYELNAALVDAVLQRNNEKLEKGNYYICDGARNINHKTNFQDYLERKFNFRKAYCKLNIVYSKKIKWIIFILYPFRKLLKKIDSIRFVHLINSILIMEEIRRRKH